MAFGKTQINMNQKKISQEYEKAIQYIYELMKNSGKLQMKTGATVTNGMTTKKQSMR